MNWLKDNPLGQVLASVSGAFVFVVLVMAVVWSMPVPVNTEGLDVTENDKTETAPAAPPIAALDELRVINEKPVFNPSRLPASNPDENEEPAVDTSVAVKGAPAVRLTGVILTPDMRIATLSPVNGQLEDVMAHEGQSLTGEYVGWSVGKVNPRAVVLESTDGQSLELALEIHDMKIKEPPKPIVPAATTAQNTQEASQGDEPLSRAEQIRQRIAERREELRLQQEEAQAEAQNGAEPTRQGSREQYQNAIRNLMNSKRKEPGTTNDKEDG